MTNPPCHIADTDKEAVQRTDPVATLPKSGFVRVSKR